MKFSDCLFDTIISQIELRAGDPWPDELWPAANTVLTQIISELNGARKELITEAIIDLKKGERK